MKSKKPLTDKELEVFEASRDMDSVAEIGTPDGRQEGACSVISRYLRADKNGCMRFGCNKPVLCAVEGLSALHHEIDTSGAMPVGYCALRG